MSWNPFRRQPRVADTPNQAPAKTGQEMLAESINMEPVKKSPLERIVATFVAVMAMMAIWVFFFGGPDGLRYNTVSGIEYAMKLAYENWKLPVAFLAGLFCIFIVRLPTIQVPLDRGNGSEPRWKTVWYWGMEEDGDVHRWRQFGGRIGEINSAFIAKTSLLGGYRVSQVVTRNLDGNYVFYETAGNIEASKNAALVKRLRLKARENAQLQHAIVRKTGQ